MGVVPHIAGSQDKALAVAETAILKELAGTAKDPRQKQELQRRLEELEQSPPAPEATK
jgi:hypothetical protein